MLDFSPPVEITTIQTEGSRARLHIAREDLLPGGTKQRAILPFLQHLASQGYSEFVYSSPFCGFAQVALAFAAQALDHKARLYCETMPSDDPARGDFHELSLQARSLGAKLEGRKSLKEAELAAATYVRTIQSACHIPLGFNHPVFLRHYGAALEKQFAILCEKIGFRPRVLWLPVGSGTLSRVFRQVIPRDVALKCVDVRVLDADDDRIRSVEELENCVLYRSEQPFKEESREIPPVPSNIYYDAKVWRFLDLHASDDDVWWNVAR